MAQGANARPHEKSIQGLLTPFRRESPVESGEGHPNRAQLARPILEPLPPAKGTFITKPRRRHCPGYVPGSLAGQASPATDQALLPRGHLSLVPALAEPLTSQGLCRPWALAGDGPETPAQRDRETRRERPSPPLALRSVLTGRRRLLA